MVALKPGEKLTFVPLVYLYFFFKMNSVKNENYHLYFFYFYLKIILGKVKVDNEKKENNFSKKG